MNISIWLKKFLIYDRKNNGSKFLFRNFLNYVINTILYFKNLKNKYYYFIVKYIKINKNKNIIKFNIYYKIILKY